MIFNGVHISSDLKFKLQCDNVTKKAYRIVNILFRCFTVNNANAVVRAYCAYVRPILEYCSAVWSPCHLTDIDAIERVQRYFTRRLYYRLQLERCPYVERLRFLNLEPLELRRLRFDLTLCYKIVHREINLDFNEFFVTNPANELTRGHHLRLRVPLATRNLLKHCFSHRVVNVWNGLPAKVGIYPLVYAQNTALFKKRLLKVDLTSHLSFDRNL